MTWYNFIIYNTLASFSVNEKPQNLYLVQPYQNADYWYNIAAVTVSLHQPVYAMVCELPLISLLHCRELLVRMINFDLNLPAELQEMLRGMVSSSLPLCSNRESCSLFYA